MNVNVVNFGTEIKHAYVYLCTFACGVRFSPFALHRPCSGAKPLFSRKFAPPLWGYHGQTKGGTHDTLMAPLWGGGSWHPSPGAEGHCLKMVILRGDWLSIGVQNIFDPGGGSLFGVGSAVDTPKVPRSCRSPNPEPEPLGGGGCLLLEGDPEQGTPAQIMVKRR